MPKHRGGASEVEAAMKAAVGERASKLMHRRSKHLGNLTPHELAQQPGGARIVLAELSKIAIQAEKGELG